MAKADFSAKQWRQYLEPWLSPVPPPRGWRLGLALFVLFLVGAFHLTRKSAPVLMLGSFPVPVYYPLLNLIALLALLELVAGRKTLWRWLKREKTYASPDESSASSPDESSASSPDESSASSQVPEAHPQPDGPSPPDAAPLEEGATEGAEVSLADVGSGATPPAETVQAAKSDPSQAAPSADEVRPRWRLLDALAFLAISSASYLLLERFRASENPEGANVGSDYLTFLTNIAAVGAERLELYNHTKRLPYAYVSAELAEGLKLSWLEAGQLVSFVSILLVPGLAYIAAAPAFGRRPALYAALLLLATPLVHPFAIYTGSYGFSFFATTATLAFATWALVSRRLCLYLLAGLLGLVSIQAQEKAATLVLPVADLLVVFTLLRWDRLTLLRTALLLLPLGASPIITRELPVKYPSLAQLILINREEVHRDMPYSWPSIRHPDPDAPFPFYQLLPASLRGGELEALAAVVLAPPDGNVLFLHPRRDAERTWLEAEIKEGTTIPPLERRLRGNLRVVSDRLPGVGPLLLLLLSLGLLLLIAPRRRERLPSPQAAWLVVASLVSFWGPLSLNVHTRYLLSALPAVYALVAFGVCAGLNTWLGPARGKWVGILLEVFLLGSLSLSVFARSERVWLKPGLSLTALQASLGAGNLESHTSRSLSVRILVQWLREKTPEDGRILDCSPMSLWLEAPEEKRFLLSYATPDTRDALCQQTLSGGSPTEGAFFVVASDVGEFRGPGTVSLKQFLADPQRWKPIYGIDPETLAVWTPENPVTVSAEALWVLEAVGG